MSEDPVARIQYAYQLLYNREPSPQELELGLNFTTNTDPAEPGDKLDRWIQYCQALLSSNELMFIR